MIGPGPASYSFVSQRLKLHYVDWGNPEAPPIVMVHGGRDHCRNWDWLAMELCKDYHVIAPDLRGHGDSAWVPDGNYPIMAFVYDLAQLIHQKQLAPVTIIGHSLGGNISLRYTGLYPDLVKKVVAIEGLGPSPKMIAEHESDAFEDNLRSGIEERRAIAGRTPRRYPSLDAAFARMKEENKHLSDEQTFHLTLHGVNQNEDGTFSWKFDNYLNVWNNLDIPRDQIHALWSQISCPALLCYGEESWASNPVKDGRIKYFKTARVETYPKAGHWLHHDQFDKFLADVQAFLKE